MKKAQGLPITTIVIAAISIIVLIAIIVFFSGGFGKIFGQTKAISGSVEADVTSAQTKCTQWCTQAQGMSETTQKISSYCTRTQPIDVNGNGTIEKNENFKCWDTTSRIYTNCPDVKCS